MIKKILIGAWLIISLLSPGQVMAGVNYYLPYPGILPDHPLYWVKMTRDRLQLWLIADKEVRAEKMLLYADKRLGAGWALIEGQKADLGVTTLTKAEKYLEQAAKLGENQSFKDKINKARLKHQEVLSMLADKTGGKNQEIIKEQIVKLSAEGDESKITVMIRVDFDGEVVEEEVEAKTALEALIKIGENKGWEIKIKNYDFGSLVETVADKKNDAKKAWIYQVNDKDGEVGADKYELKAGDQVRWSYEKVKY